MAEGDFKITTKDIIFYFLIAILIISTIVVLAIFSNKPKNKKNDIKKNNQDDIEYSEVQILNDKVYYSKNFKKLEKQNLEDNNEG